MMNLATILSVFSGVVLITACEKSPEARFDVSSIPGQYAGYSTVMESYYDTVSGMSETLEVRDIPERDPWGSVPCCPKYIVEIQKVKEYQYTFTFEPIDTILPNEITVEISGFREHSYDEIRADIRVLENDLFKDTAFHGNIYGTYNQFTYCESEWRPTISYNLLLKCKSLDNTLLGCYGFRHYDD